MTTAIKSLIFGPPVLPLTSFSNCRHPVSFSHRNSLCFSARPTLPSPLILSTRTHSRSFLLSRIIPFSSSGSSDSGQAVRDPEIEDSADGPFSVEDSAAAEEEEAEIEELQATEEPQSPIISALHSFKSAVRNEDESKITELESFFLSLEEEKVAIAANLVAITAELSVERDRVLRISADFDNFRKRTERERTTQVTNAKGEVIETLLAVLDNFERAKAQIKVETEGEEKISNSYQSIYKQFVEILASLGVAPVETVGKPFDPAVHEAILREDSSEFAEGIVMEEYRKGFKISDRLLRPSMVKVSAGMAVDVTKEESETTVEESSESDKERNGAV